MVVIRRADCTLLPTVLDGMFDKFQLPPSGSKLP